MFHGSMVAIVTPFTADGAVDTRALCDLVERHIEAGTHGIVVTGTTGESGTLAQDERILAIRSVVDQVRERIPVIAGVAENATTDAIKACNEFMGLGVDAVLVLTPFYIRPTQEGLYQHFKAIAHAVPVPIILYNVPSRTACDMQPETVARLAEVSNIIGIKEATGQMSRLQQILKLCGAKMDIYSGDDGTACSWITAGAKGVISVTANIVPKAMAQMVEAGLDGHHSECVRINGRMQKLHEALFWESNPIPVKWALAKIGRIKGVIRSPLTVFDSQYHDALSDILMEVEDLWI